MFRSIDPRLVSVAALLTLGACGLRTPEMQSPIQPLDTDALITGIVGHVKSEVGCAVVSLIKQDVDYGSANHHPRNLPWLDSAIVKMTLNLTVDEKTTLLPGLTNTATYANSVSVFRTGGNVTNGQSFALGLGANLSSDATRKTSSDYTFSVRDDFLKNLGQYSPKSATCKPYDGPLIGGDLKIADSFNGMLAPQIIDNPAKGSFVGLTEPDTLQTEITFVLAGSASASPAWKLIPTSINSATSPLFTTGRTATDDVIITLGPKGQSTQTAHNIAKAGSVVNQAITNGN